MEVVQFIYLHFTLWPLLACWILKLHTGRRCGARFLPGDTHLHPGVTLPVLLYYLSVFTAYSNIFAFVFFYVHKSTLMDEPEDHLSIPYVRVMNTLTFSTDDWRQNCNLPLLLHQQVKWRHLFVSHVHLVTFNAFRDTTSQNKSDFYEVSMKYNCALLVCPLQLELYTA